MCKELSRRVAKTQVEALAARGGREGLEDRHVGAIRPSIVQSVGVSSSSKKKMMMMSSCSETSVVTVVSPPSL